MTISAAPAAASPTGVRAPAGGDLRRPRSDRARDRGSRLARNGRDWHTLMEFCGLVGSMLADEDGVYDARLPNDRLLLGMKGTMSEMELSILRQRSLEALRQKARRGELFLTVAIGYVKARHNRIEMDPDCGSAKRLPRVPQVRRVPEHPAGSSLAEAGADPAAGRRHRGGWASDRVEAAGLQHRSIIS